MATELNCWKCGASLKDIPLPFSRYSKCKSCKADLHVCRICAFYDKTVSKMCREPIAEEVKDKQRANFCGYLQPCSRPAATQQRSKAGAGKSDLEKLFGLQPGSTNSTTTDPDAAKRQLEKLFGIGDKKNK